MADLIGKLSMDNLRTVKSVDFARPEMDRLHGQYQALLEISEVIASHRDLDELFRELAPRLHNVVQFDFASLILYEAERKVLKSHVLEDAGSGLQLFTRRLSDGDPRRLGLADTATVGGFAVGPG